MPRTAARVRNTVFTVVVRAAFVPVVVFFISSAMVFIVVLLHACALVALCFIASAETLAPPCCPGPQRNRRGPVRGPGASYGPRCRTQPLPPTEDGGYSCTFDACA